jgi:hypothetical protein
MFVECLMITMGILFKIVCLSSKFYQNIRENKILVKVAKGIAKNAMDYIFT